MEHQPGRGAHQPRQDDQASNVWAGELRLAPAAGSGCCMIKPTAGQRRQKIYSTAIVHLHLLRVHRKCGRTAFRFKPPTVSVISPTLLMGLVGERRRDPSFSPYAGIVCRAKRHGDDEGSAAFWFAARTRRMDSPVSSMRSAR